MVAPSIKETVNNHKMVYACVAVETMNISYCFHLGKNVNIQYTIIGRFIFLGKDIYLSVNIILITFQVLESYMHPICTVVQK